jgi:hypothetical protein
MPRSLRCILVLAVAGCGPTATSSDAGSDPTIDASMPIDSGASGDAGEGDAGAAGPIALDDFCDELWDWVFDVRAACGCPGTAADLAASVASCEAARLPPVTAGEIAYDAAAAARWIARLRTEPSPTCAHPYSVLAVSWRDSLTLGGTFLGTRAPGDPCPFALSNTCPADTVCSRDFTEATETYRCVPYVGLGERCDNDHYCGDLDATRISGVSYSEDAFGLWCDGDRDPIGGRLVGVCRAAFAASHTCFGGSIQCESGTCAAGTCDPLGVACTAHAECAPHGAYCSDTSGQCEASQCCTDLPGMACTSDPD